ncbi:uncharacterized protein LOC128876942 isoform X1 [Hylaeus volcanicus]|uniref:uncharacterized protein LOC128876942 isoform X1 n=1 Tax=Hylaeus volcanicus TaxID=313075 RepID=UPI0023B7CD7B|nr:uncharacterized protein LOC128876942 isoform X1 [Hylaeus volcanicus]
MRGKPFSFTDATLACYIVVIVLVPATEPDTRNVNSVGPWLKYNDSTKEDTYYDKLCLEALCVDLTTIADDLFPFVSKFIVASKLDPLTIPDIRKGYWMCVPFMFGACGKLKYSLSSGLVSYVSKLERAGRVVAMYRDKRLRIDASIVFDYILFDVDYFVELLFLRGYGWLLVEADSILVDVSVDYDILSFKFSLKELKLKRIGSMAIFTDESSLVEQLGTPVANIGLFFANEALTEEIERFATEIVEERLARMSVIISLWKILSLFVTT